MSMNISEITHAVRRITPVEAQQLLATARFNGKVNRAQIRAYAHDMSAGRWLLNGDPIILDRDDVLLSGVHRLRACMEADTSFPCLIIRGVDGTAFATIDALRRRTVGDILAIRKEAKGRALAAALMLLWRYVHDDYVNPRKRPSAHALLQILESNPDIRTSMTLAADAGRFASSAIAGAMHYLFSRVNADAANGFFEALVDEEVSSGPAFLLRNQLKSLRGERGAKSQALMVGLFIKSWEAYYNILEMKQLRYAPGKDKVPRVSGLEGQIFIQGLTTNGNFSTTTSSSHLDLPSNEIKVEIKEITPGMAGDMLARNDRNRGLTAIVVDKYARDMRAERWILNGQTIKLDRCGRLLDGQHRLAAGVKSGKTFPAIIVYGLDDSVSDTFDLGAKRNFSDLLKDRGEHSTSTLAAALRQIWLLQNNLMQSRLVLSLRARPAAAGCFGQKYLCERSDAIRYLVSFLPDRQPERSPGPESSAAVAQMQALAAAAAGPDIDVGLRC